MPGMKLQFSLATLLVCTAVMGLVCAACMIAPVQDVEITHAELQGPFTLEKDNLRELTNVGGDAWEIVAGIERRPYLGEIALRLAWAVPTAVAFIIALPWLARRLKSRRHTEPPVG
jgi:hypothetical protein